MLKQMADYCVLDSLNTSFNAIVVSLSSESISDSFNDIANSLFEKKIVGKVLLDYYLSNRSKSKRFFEIDFDGKMFKLDSFKKAEVSSDIIKKIDIFYSKNHSIEPNNIFSSCY